MDRGRLLILADDLTGALDSGVQLAHRGQRVVILTAPDVPFPDSSVYDVLVIDTETRHIGAEEAGKLVFSLVRQAKASGIRCFYKKTDSGLRGKVGAELQAVLLASGAERLHFIPAYPATDRKTIGGIQYVNGKPLAESIFSKDPIDPIHVSGVDEVIHLSADVPVKLCGAATVKQDNDACEFSGIIVHDASTMEDLAAIAERLEKADELYVTGGCAGFLEVYPMEASRDTKEALPALKERLFVLSGSVNDVTRKQLLYGEGHGAYRCHVPMAKILTGTWSDDEKKECLAKVQREAERHDLVIVDTLGDEKLPEMEHPEVVTRNIADHMGRLSSFIKDGARDFTFMIIGGDTLQGFIRDQGITALKPVAEVAPGVVLASYKKDGIKQYFITKSGAFGDEGLLETVLTWLRKD